MTGIPQEPIFAVVQVATDLSDPCGIGTRCDPRDVDSTCLQVHDGKDVERDQSVPCPYLNRREVDGENRILVCFQERGPCWYSLTVGCWLNAMSFEYICHCGIGDVVVEVPQRSLNPIETPCRILSGNTLDNRIAVPLPANPGSYCEVRPLLPLPRFPPR